MAIALLSAPAKPARADFGDTAPAPPLGFGSAAPDMAFKTLDGRSVTRKSLRGHVVIVDFWATWCRPCRMAMPGLQSISKDYKTKGVKVYGLSMDTNTTQYVRPLVRQMGITYPVSIDTPHLIKAARKYNAGALPSIYVVDKKGIVRWCFQGFYSTQDDDIRALLNKLVKE